MSIEICEKHGQWDTDFCETCPRCLSQLDGTLFVHYGYMVVNDQGYIVGAWKDKNIAEDIIKKGDPRHKERIINIFVMEEQ